VVREIIIIIIFKVAYLFTVYIPGAAAHGIYVPSWCTSLVCPFLQPIRLVDYESLKKSICRVRLFSSRFLKQFMDWASTSSWQFIPSIDEPLGKEVQTWIAVTMLLHQFPSVPSGWSVFGLFEKMWPRSLNSKNYCKDHWDDTIRYEMIYFNVRSKADISQLNLPHWTDN